MESLLPTSLLAPPQVRPCPPPLLLRLPPSSTKLQPLKALSFLCYSLPQPRLPPSSPSRSAATDLAAPSSATHWLVVVDAPPNAENSSKAHIIDHYVKILASVLGNEKDAQMCIYSASWDTHFGFCCDIDEDSARQLAGLPGVRSVKPDPDIESVHKDYSLLNNSVQGLLNPNASLGELKYWIVRMARPGVQVVAKAQIVDHYAQTLTKVLGNEKDAQASIYHVSWQKNYGFCCVIEAECARELLDVPGVLSVHSDTNPESEVKNYEVDGLSGLQDSSDTSNIKTKRLFVTGLSFYTSEKTLRTAFEGFGELVEVKIIMDKISKRSKGYAFLEYTTEEAAGAALKEMNGKIINGWMIVVDVAKKNPPPRSNRYNPRRAF